MRKQYAGLGLNSIVARTALILGMVAALCFAIAAWLIQNKAATVQAATATAELEQLAQAEAAKVSRSASETLSRVRGLADATQVMMARGNASRHEASDLVRRFSSNDPEVLGYWLEFEPNGFDGKDAEFVHDWAGNEPDEAGLEAYFAQKTPDQQASNDAGRISIYWTRNASGEVSPQINTGAENSITVTGKDAPGYYTAVREHGNELMFEPYEDNVGSSKVLMTSLMVPLKVEGQFRGVAGADIALNAIQADLAKVRPYQRGVVRLLSPTGMVLAAPEKDLLGKPWNQDLRDVIPALAKGEAVHRRDIGTQVHGEVFRVFVPVRVGGSPAPFILMVTAPADAVMAGVASIRNRVIWVGVISVLALVAVVVVLLRRMIGAPLSGIVLGVNAVAAGQLDYPIAEGGEDEVGQVSRALRKMQAELKARMDSERKIAAENMRVRIALDNAGTAVVISDQAGTIVYANPALYAVIKLYEDTMRTLLPDANLQALEGQPISRLMAPNAPPITQLRERETGDVDMGTLFFAQTAAPVVSANGERLGAVIEWRDRTQEVAVEAEVAEVIAAAARGDLSKRIQLEGKTGFFRTLAESMNSMLDTNAGTMSDVQRVLSALAECDLTQRITTEYHGVFGQMTDSTNATVERLTETIQRVTSAVDAIRTAAREIAAGNSDLSSRSEQQAASLEETAASMEELTSTVKNNAESSNQARQLVTGAADVAAQGGALVSQVVDQMNGITSASKQIENIIGVIDSIAFQTNILALNAAVEAARAGEQGRGFAVVAGEVRALAQRSAEAAKEIKGLISDSVQRVDQGAALVANAGTTMQEIVDSVRRVSDLMSEISAASQEQSTGIEQVNQTITHMDGVTQQNAAMVEQASAAAHSLQEQADELADVVAVFRTH